MYRNEIGLDVGQANELKLAFRRFDWDNTLIKNLCEGDVLGDTLNVLRGDARVVPVERTVDMTTLPDLKEERVVKHLKQGKKLWRKIRLAVVNPNDLHYTVNHLPFEHRNDHGLFKSVYDSTILNPKTMMPRFLIGQRPANIGLRDFFLRNPHLVPHHFRWESSPLLFWGTVLENEYCHFVPGMRFDYGKWIEYDRRVEDPSSSDRQRYENPCVVFTPPL